jgi:nucleoside-diphosphate-sugar epimerase
VKQTFVTGGSGFLGRTLVAELRARGVGVRTLARSDETAQAARRLGATTVRGTLDDRAALRQAMIGCDVVFHAAAMVAEWGDPAEFHRVNVAGTEHVLIAAREAGVPRLVHVSTEAVLAGPAPLVDIDERTPRPRVLYGPYARTKAMAEERAIAANEPGFATVVVRPRFIWGAGDTSVLPKIIAAVRAGRFRWIDGGRYLTSATHVRNACEGLLLAAERGQGGAVYFVVDGPPIEFRAFVTSMLEAHGVSPGSRTLPRNTARAVAAIVEGTWRLLRLKAAPPVTRMGVKMMGEPVTLNDAKARRELGYIGHVTVADGLLEMKRHTTAARTC